MFITVCWVVVVSYFCCCFSVCVCVCPFFSLYVCLNETFYCIWIGHTHTHTHTHTHQTHPETLSPPPHTRSCIIYKSSSVVRAFAHGAMEVGSILHGGPIELFLVPANVPRLVQQRPWYVLSCLWDGAYKSTHAANRKEYPMWRQRVYSLAI